MRLFNLFKKPAGLFTEQLTGDYHSEHYPYHLNFSNTKESWYKYPKLVEKHEIGDVDMVFAIPTKNHKDEFDALIFISIIKSVFDDGIMCEPSNKEQLKSDGEIVYQSLFSTFLAFVDSSMMDEGIINWNGKDEQLIKNFLLKKMLDVLRIFYPDAGKTWLVDKNSAETIDNENGFGFGIMGKITYGSSVGKIRDYTTYDFLTKISQNGIHLRAIIAKDYPSVIEDVRHIARSIKSDLNYDPT